MLQCRDRTARVLNEITVSCSTSQRSLAGSSIVSGPGILLQSREPQADNLTADDYVTQKELAFGWPRKRW